MPVKVKLKTITPIHIGTGFSVLPEDYFQKANKLFFINKDNCLRFIKEKVGSEKFYLKFNEWIEEISFKLEGEGGRKPRKEFKLSILDFVKKHLNEEQLYNELCSQIPIDNSLYHYYLYSNAVPKRETNPHIKTADNLPYIPGSSVKGLLRNCLTNLVVNEQNTVQKILINYLDKFENEFKSSSNKQQVIQKFKTDKDSVVNQIFQCKKRNNHNKEVFDVKYDLFKFIQISDFYPEEKDCLVLIEPTNFTARGKTAMTPFLEAIKENTILEGQLTVKVDELKEIQKNLKSLQSAGKWIELEEKFRFLFDIDFNHISNIDNDQFERKFIERLTLAVEDFSNAIINKDILWINRISKFDNKGKLIHFYDNLPTNAVKIGYSSGFHSVTIFDALTSENSNSNNDLKSKYEQFLQKLKILKTRIDEFPKHRKLVKLPNNVEATFGWISIEFIL
ncbi:MAG: type III-A CRISPR-associated RAMP protein Csm5 [Ignavibacteria bacterium]|nr:type III-A CRISPR-associated RAMP protein Csm5 [Ignavibacteria bacterium]